RESGPCPPSPIPNLRLNQARAATGTGSQNCSNRHVSTPRTTGPLAPPSTTSPGTRTPSTTPRPPGVIGTSPIRPATPYAESTSSGDITSPNAARQTQRQAASSSQLVIDQARPR